MYARNATRTVVWVLGLILVIAAMFLLFFETGLSNIVPLSLAVAGLLLIVGVAVMGMADRVGPDHTHDEHGTITHREPDVVERHVDETRHRGGHHH